MPSQSLDIRAADERDVPVLADLSRFVHDLHVEALPGYFRPFEVNAMAESFRTRLANADTSAYLASLGDQAVGYVVMVMRERAEDARCLARRTCEIEEIAVSPVHRQQGIARALIEHVVREARSLGIHEVELTSWSFNATAHAAFAALGFRPMVVRFRRETDEHGEG